MVSLGILVLPADLRPLRAADHATLVGVDPLAFNSKAIDDATAACPKGCGLPDSGFFCGISLAAPARRRAGHRARPVRPAALRPADLAAHRVHRRPSSRSSSARVVGIIAGYRGGWPDTASAG